MSASSSADWQHTLTSAFEVSGIGIHLGCVATVSVEPSGPNTGIRFVCQGTTVPACATNVFSTNRCTTLGMEGRRIGTVEHLLSALSGMGIDNAVITIDGPEVPILDGSALPWVEQIERAGTIDLNERAATCKLLTPITVCRGDSCIAAVPSEEYRVTCVAAWDHPLLGARCGSFKIEPKSYACEIAPARTFGFAHEIEALRVAGLGLGGALDNALVVGENGFSVPLRFDDEFMRHKALDLVGDLALVGRRLRAHVFAVRPGHAINTEFAKLLAQQPE